MFGLTFMAIGATIPFIRKKTIDYKKVSPLILLTLIGSAIGAALVGFISDKTMPIIVSVSMIVVTVFTLLKPSAGVTKVETVTRGFLIVTYVLTFFLGIYGGLYSGGYVTVLTSMLVAFFGLTLIFTSRRTNAKLPDPSARSHPDHESS